MTCIVGIEAYGKVIMGSDGCASDGYHKYEVDEPKLFIKNEILFGYTTSFRFADIIQYHVNIVNHSEGKADKQYLVEDVVPEIRKKLKDHGFVENDKGRESGGTALIGYKDKLYILQDDFSIIRNKIGYASCGSGTYVAYGSLHTTQSLLDIPPEQRILLALKAAADHSVGVSEPFHVWWNKL